MIDVFLKIIFCIFCVFFITILLTKRFVYFKPSYEFSSPIENYEDVYEGNLHAWHKKSREIGSDTKVILFCHGNAGNISTRQNKIVELGKAANVLIFDYSGYGQSRGVPNEEMCYANADTFYQFLLRRGYSKDNIIPYGESLGGAVAAYLARKYGTKKLVLESSIPGVSRLFRTAFPKLGPFLGIIFYEFDTEKFLIRNGKLINSKVLVLHSVEDEVIPYSSMSVIKEVTEEVGDARNDIGLITSKFIDMTGFHNNPNIPWAKIQKFIIS